MITPSIIINKWDSYKATLNFKEKGQPVDLSDTTLVVIVKKEWTDDEDAIFVQILPEKSGADSKIDIELDNIDERGQFVLYVKSLDEEKRFTLTEIPLIIK